MSQVFQRGPASPVMNLTPLIDVVFQLIIFFMLVNQIVSEQNVKMIVPAPTSPKTQQLNEDDKPIVVNVAPFDYSEQNRSASPLQHSGDAQFVQIGNKRYDPAQMSMLAEQISAEKASRESLGIEEVQVVLRADMALHYRTVQPVMEAIRAAGVQWVKLAAYTEEGPYDLGP